MDGENSNMFGGANQAERPVRKPTIAAQPAQATFDGPPTQVQLRLPQDLVQSLRLHSISEGKTMSQLVLECCISEDTINKAWISTRKFLPMILGRCVPFTVHLPPPLLDYADSIPPMIFIAEISLHMVGGF